jgi:hypothetical protein
VGFFKAIRELKKQSDEIGADWDPSAQVAQAQAQMQSISALITQETAAATAAAAGTEGTATILAVRPGNGMINLQPIVELDLTVTLAGGLPFPATVRRAVPHAHLVHAVPGATVPVKADPGDAASVWIDWARAGR